MCPLSSTASIRKGVFQAIVLLAVSIFGIIGIIKGIHNLQNVYEWYYLPLDHCMVHEISSQSCGLNGKEFSYTAFAESFDCGNTILVSAMDLCYEGKANKETKFVEGLAYPCYVSEDCDAFVFRDIRDDVRNKGLFWTITGSVCAVLLGLWALYSIVSGRCISRSIARDKDGLGPYKEAQDIGFPNSHVHTTTYDFTQQL